MTNQRLPNAYIVWTPAPPPRSSSCLSLTAHTFRPEESRYYSITPSTDTNYPPISHALTSRHLLGLHPSTWSWHPVTSAPGYDHLASSRASSPLSAISLRETHLDGNVHASTPLAIRKWETGGQSNSPSPVDRDMWGQNPGELDAGRDNDGWNQ